MYAKESDHERGKTRQGNRPGRGCVKEERSAALSGEFGQKMLREKFATEADAILAKLGTYSRGPRKGLPRGYIHWVKVLEGGFDYGERIVRGRGTYGWCVRENNCPYSRNIVAELCHESAKSLWV